jgi:hypothetical protein
MPTGTVGVAARQDPRQVANTLKKTTTRADVGIATGVAFENYLPQAAFIIAVLTEIVVAFNGTTPAYSVGTVGAAYNNIVAAGDVNPAVIGVYQSTRAIGRLLAVAGPVLPVAKVTEAVAGTTGTAITVIEFEGGWAS